MTWATQYIRELLEGRTVRFRPRGNSMQGRIESGQLVTVEPVLEGTNLSVGDVVLCKVEGRQWLHLIKAIDSNGRFLIGNNKGHTNGTTVRANLYGKVVKVEA